MTKAEMIAVKYGNKTDLTGRLSYGNGVKNFAGVGKVNTNIRLRVTNNHTTDRIIYLAPALILGDPTSNTADNFATAIDALGLPSGIRFTTTSLSDGGSPEKLVTIESLNRDQVIGSLAGEMSYSPVQVMAVSLRSFNATTGVGENSNYSNTITHYGVSSLRPKVYEDLSLADFQDAKDFSTSILKVDFLKSNFIAPVSSNDLLAFQVNAGTKLDITFHIGARQNSNELFFRDVKQGTQMLLDEFPGDASCKC